MAGAADEPTSGGTSPAGGSDLERAATRLLQSLAAGGPADLDPLLERFLRGVIFARARRMQRHWSRHALGMDAQDVTQRVLLKLLEQPPSDQDTPNALRRLIAWTHTVTRNYLNDLTRKRGEDLEKDRSSHIQMMAGGISPPADERLMAKRRIERAIAVIDEHYPSASQLFRLLLEAPHATSRELAEKLDTTPANVDQMRSRMRRVLKKRLDDPTTERRQK